MHIYGVNSFANLFRPSYTWSIAHRLILRPLLAWSYGGGLPRWQATYTAMVNWGWLTLFWTIRLFIWGQINIDLAKSSGQIINGTNQLQKIDQTLQSKKQGY